MYTYDFVFYKPGKKFYTGYEIKRTINTLIDHGYEVYSRSSRRPHFKGGKLIVQDKEEHLDFDLTKSGQEFSLLLGPAEERFKGALGQLSIPEEQFKGDPEKSADLMVEAANIIFLALEPLFAWGDHELEIGRLEPFLRFDRIGALAWANLFSRELVERLGGVKNVLISPSPEDEKEGNRLLKEATFLPQFLSDLPTEPSQFHIALECERRFPRALLRSFEIPPLKGIERVG